EALVAIGIREIVINLAWKRELLRTALGDGARFGARLHYSDEGAEALEIGGGVFKALPLLGDAPFIVVSADIWTDYSFARCVTLPRADDLAHFVLVPNPSFHPNGDFHLAGERVTPNE